MKIYQTSEGSLIEDEAGCHSASDDLISRLFRSGKGEVEGIIAAESTGDPSVLPPDLLSPAPADTEIWAAGVTYLRSKSARMEESENAGGDVFYDLVYEADRPELFFKSMGYRAVGTGGEIRVRKDSSWDVPEPELTLAINSAGEIFGFAIGDDVSSRSIEGENPLYHPSRTAGTLRCYRKHSMTAHPLDHPGEQDLTSDVNFSAVEETATQLGLSSAPVMSQSRYLTHCAKEWLLSGTPPNASELRQFQTLIHPSQFGNRFYALELLKGPVERGFFE
ncbi:SAM-dependent methyltransferase [bacterium]|nr:SAM-dependent methyltransferase [bacterium]